MKKPSQASSAPGASLGTPRKWWPGLLLLIVAGGTWAFFEFVVWNKLPPALVGKWVVTGGDQDGTTFDFYRNGAMVAHINLQGKLGIIKARVSVEGDNLVIATQEPQSGRTEIKTHTIKTLNERQLVLQDERKNLFKLHRAGP